MASRPRALVRGTGGVRGAKTSETPHWWGMCWDARAQRRNHSVMPHHDTVASQSLREILFKWVPHHGKWLQRHSIFTSGVPNMSGTRLPCKRLDRRRCIFQLGTPLPSLGVDGPGLPGRNSIECPITPRCHRHMPSSQLGSPRWSAPSSIEIQLGCNPTFFSVPSPTPLRTSHLATYCDTKFCSILRTTLWYPLEGALG